ncbi:MAG: V-type ATP synthase subunit E family protein [bacterium]|nr:V-type ATP synthase subunit E family protein [bacterium]
MTEKLQSLLDKINREGVKSAQEKADRIISDAEGEAKQVLLAAKQKAEEIKKTAEKDAARITENSKKAINQAFRSVMLSMKDEIINLFEGILKEEVSKAMSKDIMQKIITDAAMSFMKSGGEISGAQVCLNEKEAESMGKGLIEFFKNKLKQKVEIKPVKNLDAGFTVSFDGGQSRFDFSDESVAECLSAYISPQIREIIEKKEKKK